ncbi:CAP domain-containing protein [Streptomyces sp. NRRL S-87]|uniref:CAP domain-containing protein n=1 Tax=Streptomyces sp. NRRL S-87 TaxID=1463920 RepID=UPI0004C13936|nr:CAP domain-containing protein [Streptomyces sp. NRRL S-87]
MGRHRSPRPPRGKGNAPVRTGLLGVTAAVALGAAALTSGLVPVDTNFILGGHGDSDTKATARSAASSTPSHAAPTATEQVRHPGGLKSLVDSGASTRAKARSKTAEPTRSASPSASPSPSGSASAKPSPKPSPVKATPKAAPKATKTAAPRTAAPRTAAPKTVAPTPSRTAEAPVQESASAVEAAVLTLVNQERARAGCGPVRQNPPLAALAGAFSKDMAVRGFFDHTDPDGRNPWDRANAVGIGGLGGENIARGQGDAAAVMAAWMNSPGHRENILNCEFRTLGVGVYLAPGGPWWTQDFGF